MNIFIVYRWRNNTRTGFLPQQTINCTEFAHAFEFYEQ